MNKTKKSIYTHTCLKAGVFIYTLLVLMGNQWCFAQQQVVKIGFLIRAEQDTQLVQAAQLAIKDASQKFNRPFQLVSKSCDGLWGVGSKQAVHLIYDDQVSILVTALDGRNDHLAEQVAAKSHMAMISTLSSDLTLSRAYVPWYYRVVPDDRQQAVAIINALKQKKQTSRVAFIALDDYDGSQSCKEMEKVMAEHGLPSPIVIRTDKINELNAKIKAERFSAIVMAGTDKNISRIVFPANTPKYAFLNTFNFTSYLTNKNTAAHYAASGSLNDAAVLAFKQKYKAAYGNFPSPSALYIYEGIMLSASIIHHYGSDLSAVRKGLKAGGNSGMSGKITFDSLGNRVFDLQIQNIEDW